MIREPLPFRDAALWAMGAALTAAVFALFTFPQIPPASDLWDYSQEARQLARGEGFTSLYTYPVHLGTDHAPFPVRWRMPLYAAAGAALLAIRIPLPEGFFLTGVIAHAVLVGLVFLLGAAIHSRRAGAIAATAAILSPLLLDPYSAALSQVPTAALALGVWLLLIRGKGVPSALVAGVLGSAAWYLRAESALMVPIWLGVAAVTARGRGRSLAFLATYAALCIPWFYVSSVISGAAAPIQGNPMLLYTSEYPGYSSSRTYGAVLPGVVEFLASHPLSFVVRFLKDLLGYGVDLLWGLGPFVVGLGMAGLLLREPKGRWVAVRPALPLLLGAAIQIAAFSCLERSPRFLVPAVPLVCVALGIAAEPALDRICGRRNVILLFALVLLERSITLSFETRQAARRFPPLSERLAVEIQGALDRRAPADAMIWTDVPDWIAWHLDRPALLLPLWRQRSRVEAEHPVSAILLSPGAPARNAADGEGEWNRAFERLQPITGFAGPQVLTGGARLYVTSPACRSSPSR